MAGQTLAEQGVNLEVTPRYVSVKEAVFPFSKFLGVDPSSAGNALDGRSDGRGP